MRAISNAGVATLAIVAILGIVVACEPSSGDGGSVDEGSVDGGTTDQGGTSCTSNEDCLESENCDLDTETCVAMPTSCTNDDECSEGESCDVEAGICVAAVTSCTSDEDCTEGQTCDTDSETCVEAAVSCTSDEDCAEGQICDMNTEICIGEGGTDGGVTSCTTDDDCSEGEFCDTDTETCVEAAVSCTSDEDCPEGQTCDTDTETCVEAAINCTSDDDCPEGLNCDAETEFCIAGAGSCTSDEECPEDETCDMETETCGGGETTCESDDDCPEGETCDMNTNNCVGPDEGGNNIFPIIEITDDPNNPTLTNCDAGTLKSPGADIDAAELVEGEDIIATLTGCTLNDPGECESTASDAAAAEGAPDGTGKEETGTYVALNGGNLRCEWSDEAEVAAGQIITVYEIGGSSSTKVEQYTIRLCNADTEDALGQCSEDSTYASGNVEFETDSFF